MRRGVMGLDPRLQRVDAFRWRIPRDPSKGMRTDVVVYASQVLLEQISGDLSLDQAVNVASLPGIVGPSLAMPDIHQGYGFPIGGVAATSWPGGAVSPGGVGFDINCGVRLLRSTLTEREVRPRLDRLVSVLFEQVPCGTGGAGPLRLNAQDLDRVLKEGASWLVSREFGHARDVEHCEAQGALQDADPGAVSARAKERGRPQVGTLGSGNHFLEVQFVERIEDAEAARAFGLSAGGVVVLIHSGSRGLGHQVCTDAVRDMGRAMTRYGLVVPDRQLACVPIRSVEGRCYLSAMSAAANFAWANRQAITHFVRRAFAHVFGPEATLDVVYDVCHNIAKRETHRMGGRTVDVLVHRKGATRAFPGGHPELPDAYRDVGQPVFIPGSMGTASWVLAGQPGSMAQTFGTTCHGAGRRLSRTAAKRGRTAAGVKRELEALGVLVRSETRDGLLEEVPDAYKDVDAVIDVVHGVGLARKVARLRPMGVIKG
ncbi:MAG: RtcB family protein [Vicinamibacterales bacterium]